MYKKTTYKKKYKKTHSSNTNRRKQYGEEQSLIGSNNITPYTQSGGVVVAQQSDWFKNIFGVEEYESINPRGDEFVPKPWEQIVANFEMIKGDFLECNTAKKKKFQQQYVGIFERPTRTALQDKITALRKTEAYKNLYNITYTGLTLQHIQGSAAHIHYDPTNSNAVIQVASQFNCLEMLTKDRKPEHGVAIYIYDKTQGPPCAMACPAALIYRNYLVKHDGHVGQKTKQINNLDEVEKILENEKNNYWIMQNGYLLIQPAGLTKLNAVTEKLKDESVMNNVMNNVKVGVQWSTSVVKAAIGKDVATPLDHKVTQVFASALPIGSEVQGGHYNSNVPLENKEEWRLFASTILKASYMSTLDVAYIRSIEMGTRVKCYLTFLGGGVFGNKPEWIYGAINDAVERHKESQIDVYIVHWGQINSDDPFVSNIQPIDTGKEVTKNTETPIIDSAEKDTHQQHLLANIFSYLDPNPESTTLDYRKYGQIIDEKYIVLDRYTKKYDFVRNKRVAILIDTLKSFEEHNSEYLKYARENMAIWRKNSLKRDRDPGGLEVIVEAIDWGEMALKCTKKYGSIFACLNMANKIHPGGGYTTGPAAQEENMFRRTNCHFSIDRNMLTMVKNHFTNLPEYEYNKYMQDLIGAEEGRTYIDVKNPRICIKDKETWSLKIHGNTETGTANIGYQPYNDDDIFSFYELRCAAVRNDSEEDAFQETNMRRIIRAQFETLKDKGIRHAILGAFGCGAFMNPPLSVAALYKEYLMEYKDDFDVIAFPIYYAGYGPDNYTAFRDILLGNTSSSSIFIKGANETYKVIPPEEPPPVLVEPPHPVVSVAEPPPLEHPPAPAGSSPPAEPPPAVSVVVSPSVGSVAEASRDVSPHPVVSVAEASRDVSPHPVVSVAEASRDVSPHPVVSVAEASRAVSVVESPSAVSVVGSPSVGSVAEPPPVVSVAEASRAVSVVGSPSVIPNDIQSDHGEGITKETNVSNKRTGRGKRQVSLATSSTSETNDRDNNTNISPHDNTGQNILIGSLIIGTLGIGIISLIK